jgi:hypothetical protein
MLSQLFFYLSYARPTILCNCRIRRSLALNKTHFQGLFYLSYIFTRIGNLFWPYSYLRPIKSVALPNCSPQQCLLYHAIQVSSMIHSFNCFANRGLLILLLSFSMYLFIYFFFLSLFSTRFFHTLSLYACVHAHV